MKLRWVNQRLTVLLILGTLLIGAVLVALAVGAAHIPPGTAVAIILGKVPLLSKLTLSKSWPLGYETILFQVRLPRVVLAIVVGAALGTAGAVYQALFKNPMADPYIVGVSSGAGLGMALAVILKLNQSFLGLFAIPLCAFTGAVLATALVYQLAKVGGRVPVSSLLLAGIAVSLTLAALMSFLAVIGGKDLQTIVFWLMGGLWTANWDHVRIALPLVLLGTAVCFLYVRELNVLLLGEEKAQYLGVEAEKVKKILLAAASLVVAAAVSVSGLIGFMGLMTPHIVRLIVGPDHRLLLPATFLSGAIILLVTDTFARTVVAPVEVPVGVVTALLGGPFFIFLLRRKRKVL